MPPVSQRPPDGVDFPPTSEALDYPNGLLAVGGELSCERLLAAYKRGIFPWYEAPQPVMWWSPDPRSVLLPQNLHISRSLRKTLRRDAFELSVDRQFSQVMQACGESRREGPGTWIDADMLAAYSRLHQLGIAHSVEVYREGRLVGGLYGLALGRIFFGESMFCTCTDASKVALVALVNVLRRGEFQLIDCQVESEHINSMGAYSISRLDFEAQLAQTVGVDGIPGIWTVPATCGGLR